MRLGIAPDVAVRLTALLCFLITGALAWRLMTRVGEEAAGLAGLAAFLFSLLGLGGLQGFRLPASSLPRYTIALSVLLGVPVLAGGAWAL